jgi:hypothetical protein
MRRKKNRKEFVSVDLFKLAHKARNSIALMVEELEGSTNLESARLAWSARFIAVGGKRAGSRR